MNTEIDVNNLDFIRARCRNLMPGFMKEFEVEMKGRSEPNSLTLSKRDYILKWITLFSHGENPDWIVEQYMKFNILQIKSAFLWTQGLFAELELGAGYAWSALALDAMKQMSKKEWGDDDKNKLIFKFITDTQWYDL